MPARSRWIPDAGKAAPLKQSKLPVQPKSGVKAPAPAAPSAPKPSVPPTPASAYLQQKAGGGFARGGPPAASPHLVLQAAKRATVRTTPHVSQPQPQQTLAAVPAKASGVKRSAPPQPTPPAPEAAKRRRAAVADICAPAAPALPAPLPADAKPADVPQGVIFDHSCSMSLSLLEGVFAAPRAVKRKGEAKRKR